jgi:hypothetical protein
MRPGLATAVTAVMMGAVLAPSPAAAEGEPLIVPPSRIGDRWRVEVLGDGYELAVSERTTAIDRWGRTLDAFAVSVDGFHPVSLESKQMTAHTMYLDAASGTQIADVTAYVFGGTGGVTSGPAAYSAYETNDPDGWPGWVQAGGLLAGRTLTPGGTVTVPLVMTNSRGASSITLSVEEAGMREGARCVIASGATHFPTYTYWNSDGYQRSSISVGLEVTQCDDVPYALSTEVTYSGTASHSVRFTRAGYSVGAGAALGTAPYVEPEHHVAAPPAPFGGRLGDGGASGLPSVEAAQDAAALAPGLAAWRLANPAGYLVEAELLLGTYQGSPEQADRWRLVYAAPGGASHAVEVTTRTPVPVPVDLPSADPYPATVPPLASWPAEVATLGGVVSAWRRVAGQADLEAIHWQPLLDGNWYLTGGVGITCDGAPCGDLYGELAVDHRTGALGTGEHPLA